MPKTGRIRVSGYDERIVDVIEELVHFNVLIRSHAARLVDRIVHDGASAVIESSSLLLRNQFNSS